jgi:dihydrofolate synthase/folylpolyglutamate synthase
MLNDKDLNAVVKQLKPWVAGWYIAPVDDPRSYTNDQMKQVLSDESVDQVSCHSSIKEAFEAARESTLEADCMLVCGSFFTVAEVMSHIDIDA